jgi:hypothetical protein
MLFSTERLSRQEALAILDSPPEKLPVLIS